MNLPAKEMKVRDIQINGGLEALPETRPAEISGKLVSIGPSVNTSFGIGKGSIASVRYWFGPENFGGSLNAHIAVKLSENSRLFVTPRYGFLFDGSEAAHGFGLSLTYHKTLSNVLGIYSGGGIILGYYSGHDGTAFVSNTGISIESGSFYFNVEVNPIYQLNHEENINHFLVSPSISVGFRFSVKDKNKKR